MFDENNLELFSPYHNDTGGYFLPRLTKAVLASVIDAFMRGKEHYMQLSFQTTGDKGMMRDNSHKFCRGIKLHGQKGKVIICSMTFLQIKGL